LQAEIEGPADTPYAHKFFLIRFTFSSDFPTVPPTAHFLTKVYHPNVDISTGAICVNTLKKDWEPTHTLKHILSVIRCLLLVPFPESSLNADAGKLFMESYEEYFKRAAMHADVHGRPNSVVPSSSKDESKNNNNDENNGVLQNSSDNTQNPATKKKKLVSKKKSLKRL
jgi:ubiquitin-conjugating enzyme E2 S